MIEFIKGRKSIIAKLCVFLAAAIFFLCHLGQFVTEEGITGTQGIVKCGAMLAVVLIMCIWELKLPKLAQSVISIVIFLLGPVIIFEVVRVTIDAPRYDPTIYRTNLVFYAVVQLLIFAITQSPRVSVVTTLVVSFLVHGANEVVMLIRGTPIVPTDLLAIKTAMTVTSPGQWHFNAPMVTGAIATVMVAMLILKFKLTYPKKWIRPTAAGVGAVATALLCLFIWNIDYKSYSTSTFDQESTNDLNGVALSFWVNVRKTAFEKPEGYDKDALLEYISSYVADTLPEGKELPNIIVIMNESFSDLSYIGRLKTDTEYMSYYDSLEKNYPHGRLLVSTLGGGTCNTEFEYLTGLSMMNMPSGCYAYMQHITGEIPSMASYLKDYGYQTVAMHPFYEICWKRNSVYNFMGFDDFISGEDMSSEHGLYESADRWNKGFGDDVEYIRTLISDSFFYKQVIDQFENKTSDRIFIFGITVQNHSGYEYEGEDFETDVHIQIPEGDYPRAEQYLSLIKDSDEALEELITYFEGVEEETVIVFFGDHQPNVEAELIEALDPDRNKFVNSYLTRFQTPFVIWSNFDMGVEKNYLGLISANYLGIETLKHAGVPLSSEYKMIDSLRTDVASMATWGYYDRFACWYDKEEAEKHENMVMYDFYTYYMLKDR